MDKVIIDGVDVSECEQYRAEIETKMPYGEYEIQKDKCYYSGIEIIQNCKGNKGCIYKQLKRLEQENERIKRDFLKQNQWLQDQKKEIDELKAENEKLKSDFDKCMDANKYHFDKWCKCEQCLQEIKEMAELFNCTYENKDLDKFKKQIQDKINEVIGAE